MKQCYPLILLIISIVCTREGLCSDPFQKDVPRTQRIVIEANDLHALGDTLRQHKLGLVILFHAEYCEYCERLENDLLQPMVRSGEYDDKVLIRKIQIDRTESLLNFNGQRVTADQLSILYEASMTPTLVFVDANGEEQAERILGYTTPDLFGAYVDRAINRLHRAVIAE